MIKLKCITVLLCTVLSISAFAQHRLTGEISALPDSTKVKYAKVSLNHDSFITAADSLGHFEFNNVPSGEYSLHISGQEIKSYHQQVIVDGTNKPLRFFVKSSHKVLDEVHIKDKQSGQDLGHMRGVENMGIYEGKKSEVIIIDKLVANLATNNARQVYSRVAGLNIWENDGAGLQLSIGGRGLDPNRTSNFNVRQNGYDISADALGYPESYYTPPVEAIEKIQIVRGAASLQYGTQFGGLLNFVLRKPVADKRIQLVARQSIGSFGFYNAFTSVSGTAGKLSYYSFFQYKKGDGWRPNSHFDNYNFYTNVNYDISDKTKVGIDVTVTDYLAQQPGGLSDAMFKADPRQSNRERNWFKVNWNMLAIHFNHKFNAANEVNLRVFGLSALRNSVGFRHARVATVDENGERDLIKGTFTNWGAEARYLKRYQIAQKNFVLLTGVRYYHGFNHSTQGQGTNGRDADFSYKPDNLMTYDYSFPNRNVALFAESIIYLHDKLSITPGVRYEYINTTADGYYGTMYRDLAGGIIKSEFKTEYRNSARQFLLGGIGLSYKPIPKINTYANISQNYRSITFSDMRISSPSSEIDQNLQDEKGYSADIGIRSEETKKISYDVSLFYVNYSNRIGEAAGYNEEKKRDVRIRKNVGKAIMTGIETYIESDLLKIAAPKLENWSGILFGNLALINSEYVKSDIKGVTGNEVEFVPKVNLKSGIKIAYKKLKGSFQYTYLSDQFSDATNAPDGGYLAVVGLIPAYTIMDVSISYEFRMFKIEGSVNNLANQLYFTRRATGYPGPGILPSDGRSFYLTLQVKI